MYKVPAINAKKALELALTWDTSHDIEALAKSAPKNEATSSVEAKDAAPSDGGFLMA